MTKKYVSLIDNTTRPVAWWTGNYGQDIRMCLDDANLYRQCGDANDDYITGACSSESACSFKDGYTDQSIVQIKHTRFLEANQYGAEVASGLRDIYQNCFNPGQGPASASTCDPWTGLNCCGVSPGSEAYCCNGINQSTSCSYSF